MRAVVTSQAVVWEPKKEVVLIKQCAEDGCARLRSGGTLLRLLQLSQWSVSLELDLKFTSLFLPNTFIVRNYSKQIVYQQNAICLFILFYLFLCLYINLFGTWYHLALDDLKLIIQVELALNF